MMSFHRCTVLSPLHRESSLLPSPAVFPTDVFHAAGLLTQAEDLGVLRLSVLGLKPPEARSAPVQCLYPIFSAISGLPLVTDMSCNPTQAYPGA